VCWLTHNQKFLLQDFSSSSSEVRFIPYLRDVVQVLVCISSCSSFRRLAFLSQLASVVGNGFGGIAPALLPFLFDCGSQLVVLTGSLDLFLHDLSEDVRPGVGRDLRKHRHLLLLWFEDSIEGVLVLLKLILGLDLPFDAFGWLISKEIAPEVRDFLGWH